MPNSRALLLDTHIWIWLMEGEKRLAKSRKALDAILQAGAAGVLRVSAISVWEVSMLEAKGRLSLSLNIHEWVEKALNARGLTPIPLHPMVAIESANLPGTFYGDPADRMIVATARHEGLTLITADKGIQAYCSCGNASHLPVR